MPAKTVKRSEPTNEKKEEQKENPFNFLEKCTENPFSFGTLFKEVKKQEVTFDFGIFEKKEDKKDPLIPLFRKEKENTSTISTLTLKVEQSEKENTSTISTLTLKVEQLEKEIQTLRMDVLNEKFKVKDSDLFFSINLKKRNCLHLFDKESAKILGGITSVFQLQDVIDQMEFHDIIEVWNTLDCLEKVVEQWRFESESLGLNNFCFDQDLIINNPNQWKNRDPKILIDVIYHKYKDNNLEDLEIFEYIDQEFPKVKKEMKGKKIDEIYEQVIRNLLLEWTKNDSFSKEIGELIKFIPKNNIDEILKEMKKNFQWDYLPKWKERREKLMEILKLNSLKDKISQCNGLMIEE